MANLFSGEIVDLEDMQSMTIANFHGRDVFITHSSNYHADEVVATALFVWYAQIQYGRKALICRTNDPEPLVDHLIAKGVRPFDIHVYDIGGKMSPFMNFVLNSPILDDNAAREGVLYLDHHHDKDLPCAAYLTSRYLWSIGDKLTIALMEELEPELKELSEWDTKGIKLPSTNIYSTLYGFRPNTSNANMDEPFAKAVSFYFNYLLNRAHEVQHALDTQKLLSELPSECRWAFENKHGVVKWTMGMYLGDLYLDWRTTYDFFIVNDNRNPNNYTVIRGDNMKMIFNFTEVYGIKDIADFVHANGFMITIEKLQLPSLIEIIIKHLKHYA